MNVFMQKFIISKNIIFISAMLFILSAALSGCGKGGGAGDGRPEYVYVPEYVEMDMECDYISSLASSGDDVFLSVSKWDEETGFTTNYLYRYNMNENKATRLSLELPENSDVSGMAPGADGSLIMIVNNNTFEMDEEGNVKDSKSIMEIWKVSMEDGSLLGSQDITELVAGKSDYAYVQHFCVDGQGNLYLSDGDNCIHIIDKEYKKVCDIDTGDWINNMAASKEGDVYITSYGSEGLQLKKVDLAGKKIGDSVAGAPSGYGNQSYYTGVSGSFLHSSSGGVSRVDTASGTVETLFDWLDVDINSDYVNYVGELSDGRIWAITRNYEISGSATNELVFFTRKPSSEVPAKEEILYGTMWIGSDVKRNIINFNKTNQTYRIKVKEYGNDDYQAGLTQLNADMTTGNCPDIIGLDGLDYNQYANKGIFEDLYPYMEKTGMDRQDFLENVLEAYEVDGKLYGIVPCFQISTCMAKTSLVGERSGWTLTEMLDFVEGREAENIFDYGSRSSIFYYCIYNNIDEFINWETGECFFDGEGFIRTLEFAAQFPEEFDYNSVQEEGTSSKLRSEKILLMQGSISSVQELQMMRGLFGEEISFVGYPNSEKLGNLVQPTGGSMALSSKSKHKEGAWEFMQSFLSEEYQDSLISEHGGWGFPVRKESLEKQFEQDMKEEYYEDEDGNKTRQSKTTWGWDDFEMEIYAATPEEIEAVRELIASANKTGGNVDEQLTNIITEEAEPFFKGQKTAADVAQIIQNRIQIYVNENR